MNRLAHTLAILCIAGWMFGPMSVSAQPQPDPAGTDSLSAKAVSAFADRVIPALLDSMRVPGAVFVAVRGSDVLHASGYGWANREAQIPFDPDTTVVRVGSVSKLFTTAAILQLYDTGRLRLHDDVNTYLSELQIDSTFAAPITLHHLLTHTAGFDERLLFAGDDDPPPDLRTVLARTLPPRVRPPGSIITYSNHGMALAGRVVETASGEPFADYQAAHLFDPLGMTRSSFRQPPTALQGALATGYMRDDDRLTPLPPDYITLVPSGGLYTTGRDMGRFLSAHLADSSAAGEISLTDSTRALMHQTQARHHPGLPGRTYGFEEGRVWGQRVLQHEGGWPGWRSVVALFPEAQIGLVLVGNRQASGFGDAMVEAFARRFFRTPPPADSSVSPAQLTAETQALSGTYRFTRHPHTTFEKMVVLFGLPVPDATVAVAGDSALVVEVGRETFLLRPSTSGLYSTGGPNPTRAAFRTNRQGEGQFLLFSSAAFERIGWWETLPVQWSLGLFCLLGMASALLFPALETWVYAHGEGEEHLPENMQYARPLAVLMAGLHLGFLFVLGIRLYLAGPQGIFHLNPAVIRPMLAIPILAVVFTGGVLGFAVRAWRERVWSQAARIHYTVVAIAATCYVPFLLYWNLLARPF